MPQLKCPRCARDLPTGARICPFDGTPINSIIPSSSLWGEESQTDLKIERPNLPEPTQISDGAVVASVLLVGQKLGDYEVGSLLGQGGMGEVYAGEQPMIGKKVAIKVLKAEVAAEPGNVQRMLSEARAVNSIRHRSIVDIFNFGTLPDGRPYLVMEYLDGTALDTMLRKQGALIPAEVCEFLEEICSALAAAHGRGIVHRDLKPGNVFIVSDGNTRNRYVKLLDFGLAKGEASGEASKQTRAGMVVGTPDYIAPEQARGGTITARTDLYSLGVMAFEMLTGGLPFAAESVVELMMMHVQSPAPRVSSKIDFCPPALDALVYQLMSKSPDDRPRSAEVVRQDIARIRREMRESDTKVGTSSLLAPNLRAETNEVRKPEPDTPSEIPFPDAAPHRSPSLPPLPTLPNGSLPRPVEPTARYTAVQLRERTQPQPKRRSAVLMIVVGGVALLGAGAIWFFTQTPVDPIVLIEPPPIAVPDPPRPPPLMVVTPENPRPDTRVEAPRPDPKPAPTPKQAPIKPRLPPPKQPPAVAAAPTKQDLRGAVAEHCKKLSSEKIRPAEIEKWSNIFLKRIDEAKTPADLRKIQFELAHAYGSD